MRPHLGRAMREKKERGMGEMGKALGSETTKREEDFWEGERPMEMEGGEKEREDERWREAEEESTSFLSFLKTLEQIKLTNDEMGRRRGRGERNRWMQ